MKYDPDLKQKVERLARAAKDAENRGDTYQAGRLFDDLLVLCTPPAKSAATKWSTQYFDRVAQDIEQEVRLGIVQAFQAWVPEKGPFFGYMMFRPKRNVRRIKGVYPLDLPSSISDSRREKLTGDQLSQLELTQSSFFFGLSSDPITNCNGLDDEVLFRMAELRASVPEWAMALLLAKYVEGMSWQELEKLFKKSRKELKIELAEAAELLRSALSAEY